MSQLTTTNSSSPTPDVGVGCFIIGTKSQRIIQNGELFISIYTFNGGGSSDEAFWQFVVPVDMTIDRMYVNTAFNDMNEPNAIYFRVNGVNTALSVTVPNGFIGTVSNIVDSVTLSAGDLINLTSDISTGAGIVDGSISFRGCTASSSSTVGVSTLMRASDTLNQFFVDSYLAFYGTDPYVGEENATNVMPYAGVISNLYIDLIDDISTGPTTFTVRKNSFDTALAITIPAATSGISSNLVNTVSVVAGDRISIKATAALGSPLFGSISAKFVAT